MRTPSPALRRRAATVVVAAAAGLTAAGCGSASSPGTPGRTTDTTGATTSVEYPEDPPLHTPSSGPRGNRVTADTAVRVVRDPAAPRACVTAELLGQAYVLQGAVAGLTDGARVRVTGWADPSATDPCQAGVPFVVESWEPVE